MAALGAHRSRRSQRWLAALITTPTPHAVWTLQHVDPWNVQGGADGKIDYNKLVEQVGPTMTALVHDCCMARAAWRGAPRECCLFACGVRPAPAPAPCNCPCAVWVLQADGGHRGAVRGAGHSRRARCCSSHANILNCSPAPPCTTGPAFPPHSSDRSCAARGSPAGWSGSQGGPRTRS